MWPWPWRQVYFLNTFTMFIIFEKWVLEFLYFKWIFLVIISLYFELDIWRILKKYIDISHTFYTIKYESFHIAHGHYFWQDLFTVIKIVVLVTLAIFGIGHDRGSFLFHILLKKFLFAFFSRKICRFNVLPNMWSYIEKKVPKSRIMISLVVPSTKCDWYTSPDRFILDT